MNIGYKYIPLITFIKSYPYTQSKYNKPKENNTIIIIQSKKTLTYNCS